MIINAAGVAAAELNPELKIVKRKGHLAITERYPNFVRHQLIELGYLKSAHGSDADSVAFNVQPRSTGQILLGSSRQFGVDNSEIDFDILRRMTNRAFEYMPALKELSTVRVWTGFRPATPDNLPYIGKIEGTRKYLRRLWSRRAGDNDLARNGRPVDVSDPRKETGDPDRTISPVANHY